MTKLTCLDMEVALAAWIGPRSHVIVPNVSWGLMLTHECDILSLSRAGYATEIEIKITKSDLIRDKLKRSGHRSGGHWSPIIRYLYFAMPDTMSACIEHVPQEAGVLLVDSSGRDDVSRVQVLRRPRHNPRAKPFTPAQRLKLAELGTMRIWRLKEQLRRVRAQMQLPLDEAVGE